MLQENVPVTGQHGLYASAALDKNAGEVILKMVNASANVQVNEVEVKGVSKMNSVGKIWVLKSSLDGMNSLSDPMAISPTEQTIPIKGKRINLSLAPYSFSVVKIKIQ
jgi:alpha-L-arabinofuranosidase